MKVERYTWEDALIEAQAKGIIGDGPLLLALKLARAINWVPKDGRPSGLYWRNQDAVAAVGSSRATYFRHRKSLIETGFFTVSKGNLIPTVPELSQLETIESHIETAESHIETPYSEDTYSEDVFSEEQREQEEESLTNETVPSSPTSPLLTTSQPSSLSLLREAVFPSFDVWDEGRANHEDPAIAKVWRNKSLHARENLYNIKKAQHERQQARRN